MSNACKKKFARALMLGVALNTSKPYRMKKLSMPVLIAVSATMLLTGCIDLQLGGGSRSEVQKATMGQQLIDLQKAKDSGAITDAEYQAQKAKFLDGK